MFDYTRISLSFFLYFLLIRFVRPPPPFCVLLKKITINCSTSMETSWTIIEARPGQLCNNWIEGVFGPQYSTHTQYRTVSHVFYCKINHRWICWCFWLWILELSFTSIDHRMLQNDVRQLLLLKIKTKLTCPMSPFLLKELQNISHITLRHAMLVNTNCPEMLAAVVNIINMRV